MKAKFKVSLSRTQSSREKFKQPQLNIKQNKILITFIIRNWWKIWQPNFLSLICFLIYFEVAFHEHFIFRFRGRNADP